MKVTKHKFTIGAMMLCLMVVFIGFGQAQTGCTKCTRPDGKVNKEADVDTLELSKEKVFIPCPPGLKPRSGSCDDSDMKISVSTKATDKENDVLTYKYTVSGGRILGSGANVTWDLSGVRPGTYTITVAVDDGCGYCGKTMTKTVTVIECSDCAAACVAPTVSVDGPSSSVKAGDSATITASVPDGYGLTYNWTLSNGTISSGQGTPVITVDTTDLAGQDITVAVEVMGGCQPVASTFTFSVKKTPKSNYRPNLQSICQDFTPAKFNDLENPRIFDEIDDFQKVLIYTLAAAGTDYEVENYDAALEKLNWILKENPNNSDGLNSCVLNILGAIYSNTGNYQKAISYYQKILPLAVKSEHRRWKVTALANIGLAYLKLKKYAHAISYFKTSISAYTKLKDDYGLASTLNDYGAAQRGMKFYKQAVATHTKALNLAKSINNSKLIGDILGELGRDALAQNRVKEAIQIFKESLVYFDEIADSYGKTETLLDLMKALKRSNQLGEAIFYGKQGINLLQKVRQNIKNLSQKEQDRFLKSKANYYRTLAELLISQGRLPEAQDILNLLKEEEYGQLTRSGETSETVPYSQAEDEVIDKIKNLVTLERERTELQKLLRTNGELSTEQNNKLAKLNLDIAAANKAFDAAIDALGKAEASATTRVDEIKGGKVLQSALTELSEKTNSGVVALYTVLGTEEEKDAQGKPIKDKRTSKFGWVIMVTENRYTAYSIDVTNLEDYVFQFQTALSSPTYNPQPLAEKIYHAIFRQTSPKLKKTLEQDLQEYLKPYPNKTLMWSLDGVLRYIPMAALHDGKGYLVENYQNTVFTEKSFVWLMNNYENNWKALGLGVSDKRPNFSELPGVKTELETIVRETNSPTGILNGSIKLNDNFKKQTFFNIVGGGAFPVVHISSHYSFNSAKPENSFLLAGDGNLTFAEIKEQQNLFKKVDLLTLSACDTGVSGNGKEAEGFAYLAQSLGAKSVIASLWKVSDAGTPELMIRFYKLRSEHPEMTKGEAFRQAQLELLGSEMKAQVSSTALKSDPVDLSGTKIDLPLFEKNPKKPFAHPHYWSSFVLIGNWK